jgi:two-component system OmpR family response regulator
MRFHGFETLVATTAKQAVAKAREHRPDLVLLDVMLPDGDGWQVCRDLRAERDDIAVIFLTARDSPTDVVGGLTVGGDDYITKPFNIDEVVARVHAVLRRSALSTPQSSVLRYADLELDERAYTVRRAGQLIDLTPAEYNLLRYLLHNAERIVTKEQILQQMWEYDFALDSPVVETYISYLRRKLDKLGPPLIVTRRGIGYGLRESD